MPRQYHTGRPRAVPQIAKDAWARVRQPRYVSQLAAALGVSRAAVSRWRHVPEDRVPMVAAILGLPERALRPDLYGGYEALMPPPLSDYLNRTKEP